MESILAIGLVMSVVISSIGISIYTTRLGRASQNNLVAYNLAREGIEYARNVRDSNWLKGQAWNTGLDGCAPPNWCTLDFNLVSGNWVWIKAPLPVGETDINDCISCQLKIDDTDGHYNLINGAVASGFYRVIQIDNAVSPIKVIVKVKRMENNRAKIITLEEDLTDWRYE